MVEIPGEDMITAVCKTESFGKIGAVDVVLDDIAGDQNYSLDRLQIEINDPNGKNFYFLKVIYFYDVVFEDGFELRDMRLGYIYNASSVLSGEADSFTDELFEGKNEILEFWSERYTGNSRNTLKSGNYEEPDAMVVGLWSLTEEEYNFRKSISNNRDAEDNPFAEPTIVFSNIENGLGIFSLMKLNEFEVEL